MNNDFVLAGFSTREMTAQDVSACARLGANKTPHEKLDPELISRLWPKLLASQRMRAAVVEDDRGQIIAFGASTFLTEEFVQRLRSDPTPLISRQVIESEKNPKSKICTVDAIAYANANSGLTCFILHSGLSDIRSNLEHIYIVKAQLLQAFFELHRGYNVSNFLAETHGSEELAIYEATGLKVYSDYSTVPNYTPASPRPFLLGISRQEALKLNTTPLLPLFLYRKPLFAYSISEQRLLQEAIKGRTDEELAVVLRLSLSAVKKKWVRIFEKTEAHIPQLRWLPQADKLTRGPQRRHALVRELRNRPEELTPYCRQASAAAKA